MIYIYSNYNRSQHFMLYDRFSSDLVGSRRISSDLTDLTDLTDL